MTPRIRQTAPRSRATPLGAALVAAAFAGLTLVPGVWSLSATPLDGLGWRFGPGTTQRLYEARFEDHVPLATPLRQGWRALTFGLLGETAEGALAGAGGMLFTAEEFQPPAGLVDFEAALHEAREAIAAAGGELVPVIVPDKARMQAHRLAHRRGPAFAARYDALLATIAAAGLRSVDLRPALTGDAAFLRTDTHWSPAGAKAAAAAIAAVIGPEVAAPTAFETTPRGTAPFEGDLLAFADTGAWRPLTGPAPETIARFETQPRAADAGLGGLLGAASVPVALVGTSFTAREVFHFAGFLKSALQADVAVTALQGQGPFVPMTQFLTSGDLAAAPPQFVLWEIPERYLPLSES